MSLLILLGGFAVAIIVASATYRLLMRSRGVKAPSTALPRPDLGALLFTEGQRPVAIVLSTIVGLGILSGFLYALYPDFFNAFRASRIFVPTYLGIIVVAVLRTRKQEGWRSLGSLVLLLLVGAGGREIWIRRPPSLPKQETVVQTAPPVEVYRELFVVAPKDGSWSPWIDTYGTGGVKWYKATRNDFVVGTEAGEAYSSSVTVPPGRVFRFRSTNGRESRIQVVGARLSYVQPGIIAEPADVELSPPGPREDSLTVSLTFGSWSDSIVARGALVEFELLEGSTDLYVRDDSGRDRMVMISKPDAEKALPVPVEYVFIKPTGWREPMTVKVRFRRP